MNHRFTLDVPSFQKLLEAAWVLQCQHDRDLGELRDATMIPALPSQNSQLPANTSAASRGDVFEAEKTSVPAPSVRKVADPIVLPTPPVVVPVCRTTQVVGALALAQEHYCSAIPDPIAFPRPEVTSHPIAHQDPKAPAQTRLRVPVPPAYSKEQPLPVLSGINLKSLSRSRAIYAVPVAVLLILFVFLFSQLGSHQAALSAVKAAPLVLTPATDDSRTQDFAGPAQSPGPAASERRQTGLHLVEPSHLHVTDSATESVLDNLSPSEIETLRRQAEYGDASAALTLGMAYEIGHDVRQSCAQAAHWVQVAAEEGDSAAQYNLALRYSAGDGTPRNRNEARKWLRQAAKHGYGKARRMAQLPGF
jgi:hypothetical protein